jgi:hypothetical protein
LVFVRRRYYQGWILGGQFSYIKGLTEAVAKGALRHLPPHAPSPRRCCFLAWPCALLALTTAAVAMLGHLVISDMWCEGGPPRRSHSHTHTFTYTRNNGCSPRFRMFRMKNDRICQDRLGTNARNAHRNRLRVFCWNWLMRRGSLVGNLEVKWRLLLLRCSVHMGAK